MLTTANLPVIRGEYREKFILKPITWFKVGGPTEIFFKPKDEEDLIFFLSKKDKNIPVTIIGACSNLIIRDGGISGATIKLGQNFTDIAFNNDNSLTVGAACLNFNLSQFCLRNSITGFEFLVGIPGTIGGGVAMNAGCYGREFKDIVKELHALTQQGDKLVFTNREIGFKYRGNNLPDNLIFTKVVFNTLHGEKTEIKKLMEHITSKRQATQPIKEKTGGSTFANPDGHKAWQLIDQAGMRGKKVGDAQISNLHCNFMINLGNATASDLEKLGEMVREKVQSASGINLKWEIKRLGNHV